MMAYQGRCQDPQFIDEETEVRERFIHQVQIEVPIERYSTDFRFLALELWARAGATFYDTGETGVVLITETRVHLTS